MQGQLRALLLSSHCGCTCSIRNPRHSSVRSAGSHKRVCAPRQAVKERETILEDGVSELQNRKKPDMNAATTSAKAVDGNDTKSQKTRSSTAPAIEKNQGKAVLFGPSSRLTNKSATKKRKQSKSLQTRSPAESLEQNSTARRKVSEPKGDKEGTVLEDLNPYAMGRRSRMLLENVWQRFTNLSSPGRVSMTSDELERMSSSVSGEIGDFETPEAAVTNVLVLGATGRVGRILVRKLLLRGYPVTVLVRPDSPGKDSFPEAVKVLFGDVGDYKAVRAAVEGVDKVIYCANARTTITADVKRICEDGVTIAAKALQDERNCGITPPLTHVFHGVKPFPSAKKRIAGGRQSDRPHKRKLRWVDWQVLHVGTARELASQTERRMASRYAPTNLDRADLYVNKRRNLVFCGTLYTRSAYATTGIDLDFQNEGLAGTVGLVVRVKGDGQTYALTLTTESGDAYMARFPTNGKFQNVRIPYNAFRKADGGAIGEAPQQLDPAAVRKIAVRFEYRARQSKRPQSNDLAGLSDRADRGFRLEINRIHALPAGTETDFILLSCAGVLSSKEEDPMQQEKVTSFKRRGEAGLRVSGLGYTIIRPGPIIEEPGGYKALVFDQGNRIRQSISRADVADVCLKSLHDSAARNKTFEVCHEYQAASGLEMYELVAHLPDKANSYLTPALANLERET